MKLRPRSRGSRTRIEVVVKGLRMRLGAGGTIRIQVNPIDPEGLVDLGRITELVLAAGLPCEVQQTGGNVATIFAGRPYYDRLGYWRCPVLCGPGTYDWEGERHPAWIEELAIGPDDDGDDPDAVAEVRHLADRSEAGIAEEIVRRVRAFERKGLS